MKRALHKLSNFLFRFSYSIFQLSVASIFCVAIISFIALAAIYLAYIGFSYPLLKHFDIQAIAYLVLILGIVLALLSIKDDIYQLWTSSNDSLEKHKSHDELFIEALSVAALIIVVASFITPFIILLGQSIRWLKEGVWLSLPTVLICCEEWKGLASLPVSLTLPATGIVIATVIYVIADSEKDRK